MSKKTHIAALIALVAIVVTGCKTTSDSASSGSKWTCDARNLSTGNYSGGSTAYIHLIPYSYGHDYPVTKVSDKKVTGSTGDGTPFTCEQKGEFSFTYEWGKIPLCNSGSPNTVPNPIFTFKNVPTGTKTINIGIQDLDRPGNHHGGGTIKYKGENVIQPGQFEYTSPCPPDGSHTYEWTGYAKDKDGETIGQASAKKDYP